MWKPGTSKPSVEKKPTKTPPSAKRLSGSTMGMRFMQKRNTPVASTSSELQQTSQENDYTTCRSISTASNSDMYGVQSDLIGRRSFGGFKKPVDDNWQACLKGRAEHRIQRMTDEELLRRYKESRHGEEARLNSGKKRKHKSNGISEKRRK